MKVQFAPDKGEELLGCNLRIVNRKRAVLRRLLKDIVKNGLQFY